MVIAVSELQIIKEEELNTLTRRQLFEHLNSQRKKDSRCAANRPYFNDKGELIAIRCNCGKKTYHPVYGVIVDWDIRTSSHTMSPTKKLNINDALWLFEE